MSEQTNIEWADSTWNPWQGCTKVSLACDHCYAERHMARFKAVEWGAGQPRVRTSAANWKLPERWNKLDGISLNAWGGFRDQYPGIGDAELAENGFIKPRRRRVFCASLADWLDNEVPIEWLVDLLDLIRRTPNLDWLLLTKRIVNWRKRIEAARDAMRDIEGALNSREIETLIAIEAWLAGQPPANVWLGATVVNQAEADRDVPKLLQVPARVRFLSIEPMLGAVDLTPAYLPCPTSARYGGPSMDPDTGAYECCRKCDYTGIGNEMGIDWVIAGGESGPHARPMHPDWVRSLRDQCAAAGVPFLFKQWGEWHPEMAKAELFVITSDGKDFLRGPDTMNRRDDANAEIMWRIGKKAAGRQLDGRTHDGFPVGQP